MICVNSSIAEMETLALTVNPETGRIHISNDEMATINVVTKILNAESLLDEFINHIKTNNSTSYPYFWNPRATLQQPQENARLQNK